MYVESIIQSFLDRGSTPLTSTRRGIYAHPASTSELESALSVSFSFSGISWAAFIRHITAVYNFDKSKEIPVNKFTGELKKPPIIADLIPIDADPDLPF